MTGTDIKLQLGKMEYYHNQYNYTKTTGKNKY